MSIVKHKKIYFTTSLILIVLSLFFIYQFGLNLGVDFKGGTIWQIRFEDEKIVAKNTTEKLKKFFEKNNIKDITVYSVKENNSFLIRLPHLDEKNHQFYLDLIEKEFSKVEELRFESIGPLISQELKRKAIWAVILALLGISIYVIYAFYKFQYPVKPFKYGFITLITLFHDVLITTGFLSLLSYYQGISLDTKFIIAILTIAGFSVHDTIVVFDRIRENISLYRHKLSLAQIIDQSIKQTFARSINTSLTLIFVLLALFFVGPYTLKYFVLIIAVGVIIGTYSSIFIASPLLTVNKKTGK